MSTTTATEKASDTASHVNHWWLTRPVRPAGERKLAGVAAAIGYRYDIDPTIVRIAFVCAALVGGAGISMYLLCWLLFRYQDDALRVHDTLFHRGGTGRSLFLPILLVIVLLISWPSLTSWSEFGSMSVIGMLLFGVGAYLLYRRSPEPPAYLDWAYAPPHSTGQVAAPGDDVGAATPVAEAPPAFTMTNDQRKAWERYGGERPYTRPSAPSPNNDGPVPPVPPAWDPLGTASFAWDLPDPETTLAEKHAADAERADRRKSRILTWTTLGLAAAATAVTIPLAVAGHLMATQVMGVSLAIVALGMLIGAFFRTGQLLIPVALVLGAAMTMSSLGDVTFRGPIGDTEYNQIARPDTITDLNAGFAPRWSSYNLDLRDLGLSGDATTHLDAVGSHVVITPNPDYNLRLVCGAVKAASCADQTISADSPDAPTLVVTVDLTASEMEVQR